jgi:NADPH:quinone reductase-like Zn-dependent oxidoreductase
MRAIVFNGHGGPEVLSIAERPDPHPRDGMVIVRVRAFGLNRAATYMRRGIWGEVAAISGIECVGEVENDPSGRFPAGTKVAALMGGMGRSIDGSYAERTSVPRANVVPLVSTLSWADLAAIPESFATAWTCLMRNLALGSGQTVLIRGGTSALGLASITLAAGCGARVLASTRRADRAPLLLAQGAHRVVIEKPNLAEEVRRDTAPGLDAVLDIVGTATLLDSLAMTRRGGRVCMAGFLGGHGGIADFDPLHHLPSGVQLSLFASFLFGSPGFPLDDVPLQSLVSGVEAGRYRAGPARVFPFEEIGAAHRLMETGGAGGKLVVTT